MSANRQRKPKAEKCRFCGGSHLMVDKSGPDGAWMAKCTDCRKTFPYTGVIYFQGEAAVCALCGKLKPDAPNTDWRVIELDNVPFHVCTDHFPADDAPAADFETAYADILRELAGRLKI